MQFFNRSLLIILFFSAISYFFLCSFLLIFSFNNGNRYSEVLSGNAIKIEINQNAVSVSPFLNKDLLSFIEKQDSIIIFKENTISNGLEIYSTSAIEGFFKLKGDKYYPNKRWENDKNFVVLSSELVEYSYRKGGKYFYTHENISYEVIGTFHKGVNDYYVPLKYSLNEAGDSIAFGSYYLDAGKNTDEVYKSLELYVKEVTGEQGGTISKYELFEENYQSILDNGRFNLLLISSIAMLLLLNIYSVIKYWVAGKQREVFVRKLSGGSNKQIIKCLSINYLILVLMSSALGVLCYIITARTGALYSKIAINTQLLFYAFSAIAIVMVIGMVAGSFLLRNLLKRQLVEIARCL